MRYCPVASLMTERPPAYARRDCLSCVNGAERYRGRSLLPIPERLYFRGKGSAVFRRLFPVVALALPRLSRRLRRARRPRNILAKRDSPREGD
jgi:hypothetical protein